MLAVARAGLPPERALPGGLAFEQKPDGFRAVLFAGPGRAYLQSRNGADLSSAFPAITAAGRALHAPLVLDGELVVARRAVSTSASFRPGPAAAAPVPGRPPGLRRRI